MMEIWRDIPGYSGLYQVSNFGNVKRLAGNNGRYFQREHLLKTTIGKNGYLHVTLTKNSKCKCFAVHKIVALVFVFNPYKFYWINHKNENKTDNRAENLEWCTAEYNVNFGTSISRMRIKKERAICQMSKNGNVLKIFNSAKDAARVLNIDHSRICKCLRNIPGYNSAGGFYWKFLNYANG